MKTNETLPHLRLIMEEIHESMQNKMYGSIEVFFENGRVKRIKKTESRLIGGVNNDDF